MIKRIVAWLRCVRQVKPIDYQEIEEKAYQEHMRSIEERYAGRMLANARIHGWIRAAMDYKATNKER